MSQLFIRRHGNFRRLRGTRGLGFDSRQFLTKFFHFVRVTGRRRFGRGFGRSGLLGSGELSGKLLILLFEFGFARMGLFNFRLRIAQLAPQLLQLRRFHGSRFLGSTHLTGQILDLLLLLRNLGLLGGPHLFRLRLHIGQFRPHLL